ncbi:MAG: methyltransferase [Pseudomonadota bacterium]
MAIRQGDYRAGADPVLLAASVPARPGQSVLELGVGAGVALLCMGSRIGGLRLVGVERDQAAVALAKANAVSNGIEAEIIHGDVAALPSSLTAQNFDYVMMNPPFFDSGTPSPSSGRQAGRHEDMPLSVWLDAGIRRLKPGGRLTLVQRTARVPDIISAISDRLGGIVLLPLVPRAGRDAKLVLIAGEKGARAPFRLLPPFVLHSGESHTADGDSYTSEATAILRDGAPLIL